MPDLALEISAIGKVGTSRKADTEIALKDTSRTNEDGTVRQVANANLEVRVPRDDGGTMPAWIPVTAFGPAAGKLASLKDQLVYVQLAWNRGGSREKGGYFRDTFIVMTIATVAEHEAAAK